jgi:hypothetical protein
MADMSAPRTARVMLVEDHLSFRQSLALLLSRYFASYRTSYDTRTEPVTNFRGWRIGELLRISLLRTRVNKGDEKGPRLLYAPT